MPYSSKLQIPVAGPGRLVVVNLENFPHGELLKTTEGEKGPIAWYEVPRGVEVLAYDEDSRGLVWAPVSNWSVHKSREVVLVNLESGRQIVTDDDPRAVYGTASGSLRLARYTPSEALGARVLVPRARTLPDFPADLGFYEHREPPTSKAEVVERIPLTEDFGYLVGALVGDGWLSSESNQVCLSGITDEIVDKCDRILKALFTYGSPKRGDTVSKASYGESRRSVWGSAQLVRVLKPLVGHGADNKHLPEFFLRSPVEFRRGLLAGLMDTDGNICVNARPQLLCQFQTNSIRLAQEFVWLTMSLDIPATIVPSKTPAGRPCWQVSLSSPAIQRWGARGMVHPTKLASLAKAPVSDIIVSVRNDRVPITESLALAIRKAIGQPKHKENMRPGQNGLYSAFHKAVTDGYLPRGSASRVAAFLGDKAPVDHPDWPTWSIIVQNENVCWDLVTEVVPTGMLETGYDLTVPGYETFTSVEGIVLSNTMNFTVPASDKAVKQAMDRMLPSKSLLSPADFKSPMFAPSQQFQIGLWEGSSKINKQRPVRVFRNTRDVAAAMARGEIDHETRIRVLEDPK